jgi:hypothetical protein
MSTFRQSLTCLCLAMIVSASIPCRAESGEPVRGSREGSTLMAPHDLGVDLRAPQWTPAAGTQFAPSSGAPLPLRAQMQANGSSGSGHMSGKKKAWIIIGSVLGVVAIAAVAGNHGGGGGSGGGGGY